MPGFFFSPYGVLPGDFKKMGNDDRVVMTHWRPNDDESDRIASFRQWRHDRLGEITEFIWPKYDPKTDDWIGAAGATAKDLTELDLEVMIDQYMPPNDILSKTPAPSLASPQIESHLEHYKFEDVEPPGINYRQYDRTLQITEEADFLTKMHSAVAGGPDGIGEKIAGHFWFKAQLQRPRPLHAALRLNLEGTFESQLSLRGQHPSIVSGHCLQGIMMCCAVLEFWLEGGALLDPEREASLAQYMVDVGDRRVFAGVHYPSDNIASWIIALSLMQEVFRDPDRIEGFVRKAILEKSRVFAAISAAYFTDPRASRVAHLLTLYKLVPATV